MVTNNDINYVIIQAGGKGTRMDHFCHNKPKCLLPVDGQPILFHLINTYKNKNIILIGDYKFELLKKYVNMFCKTSVTFIKALKDGTSAGLEDALMYVPSNEPFIFVWSDLLIKNEQKFQFSAEMLVGLSNTFDCRWKYENNNFNNEQNNTNGVSGFFAFKNKEKFKNINCDQSFVRGFVSKNFKNGDTFYLQNVDEIGTAEKYEEYIKNTKCRFFNSIKIYNDKVVKKCIDKNYNNLIDDEISWYKYIQKYNFENLPKLISESPYTITRLPGNHCFHSSIVDLDLQRKNNIIKNYATFLNNLHSKEEIIHNNGISECKKLYFDKTISRVNEIKDFLPFFNNETIKINGILCRNIFHDKHLDNLEKIVECLYTDRFNIIHGDLTFSNSLVDTNDNVYVFDPRGSFGSSKIFGDKKYEWAKVYYSLKGNYDSINSKNFVVDVKSGVEFIIKSNHFEQTEDTFFSLTDIPKQQIKLLHSLIWLSLTGYVKEDIDSVLCSFYNGLLLLETYEIF